MAITAVPTLCIHAAIIHVKTNIKRSVKTSTN